MSLDYEESSGNVFLDIGFPPAEAENLMLRGSLSAEIIRLIKRKKLTQARAAKLFGVTQPRISNLMRGKIELFSIDSLISMLGHAGLRAKVTLSAAA